MSPDREGLKVGWILHTVCAQQKMANGIED